jgi:hypothetical protein
MRVRGNPAVLRHDRTLKNAGRRDQQLIGWIAAERLRQLGGFHHDPRMEMQKRHAGFRESTFYPEPDGSVEFQPSVLYEFGDFPTRADADPEDAVSATFESSRCLGCSRSDPETHQTPNVGVQQNHCKASQSWLATGSNG